MAPPVRVGIVGAGYQCEHVHRPLLTALQDAGRVAIVGITDIDAGRAQRLADAAAIPVYHDLAGLLAADCDAVVVAASNESHVAVARQALQAGKHVLVEKPLAANASHARSLIALAHRRRTVIATVLPYGPVIHEAQALVRAGAIGKLEHARAWWTLPAQHDPALTDHRWPVVWDLGPHLVGLIHALTDFQRRPVWVTARLTNRGDEGPECGAWLCVTYADGFVAQIELERNSHQSCESVGIHLSGTAGDLQQILPTWERDRDERFAARLWRGGAAHAGALPPTKLEGFEQVQRAFIDACQGHHAALPPPSALVVDELVLEAAYRSHQAQRPVRVAW